MNPKTQKKCVFSRSKFLEGKNKSYMNSFNPNTTRDIVLNAMNNRANGQARNPPVPLNNNNNNNANNNNNNNSNHHKHGPPSVFILTEPPRRVPLLYLSEPWSYPLYSCITCEGFQGWFEGIFCTRCHLMGQLQTLRNIPKPEELDEYERKGWRIPPAPQPLPFWFMPCLLFCDAVTAGNPLGFGWPGLGSAVCGCNVRTKIRKRYRIIGSGLDDLITSTCCFPFGVRQQERELSHHDLLYSVPWASDCCVSPEHRTAELQHRQDQEEMV
jgi:Cys-rich protein (TIGR01571 family)